MRYGLGILLSASLASGCASLDYTELRPDQKFARLMMLEDERSLGAGEIVTRLSDPSPRIRLRATLALGRIGSTAGEPHLVATLSDPDSDMRAVAAFSLGLLEGPLSDEALTALEKTLSDVDAEVRGRAAETLGRKGPDPVAVQIGAGLRDHLPLGIPPLQWGEDIERSQPKTPHPDLRLGLFALAQKNNLRSAWSILATEQSEPRFIWWPAAWSSAQFRAEEVAPLLLHYAGSSDPYLRALGARGLARLPREQSERAIVQLLTDPNEKVRIEAVRAAGTLGLSTTVPRLLQLLSEDTTHVKIEAIRALATLPDPRAVDPLIYQMSDPNPWLRSAALRAVAFQDRASFWLLLSGMDPDGDWSVRAALAGLLGQIGGDRATTLLKEMVDDRDFRVRPVAIDGLVQAAPSEAGPIVLEHLKSEDPFERAAAANGLGELRPEGGVARLLSALEASLREDVSAPGLAILSALERYGTDALKPGAQLALQDRSWLVRKRAAEVLRSLGEETARAEVLETGRNLYDYMDLLDPPYTPHAFIRTEKGIIEVELFIIDAPLTVANFMKLAREGFYNGLSIDRVVPNFLIEGGDPRGDGLGGPGYTVRSEVNRRPFLRGTLGMTLPGGKDTAASQFFITHLPQPQMAGIYTPFGQVIKGMDLVDRLVRGDIIQKVVIWDGVTAPSGPTTSSDQPPSNNSVF
jgi:HEAT repeat protein